MDSILAVGFLIMLTLLVKALLLDNDAPQTKPQYVKVRR